MLVAGVADKKGNVYVCNPGMSVIFETIKGEDF